VRSMPTDCLLQNTGDVKDSDSCSLLANLPGLLNLSVTNTSVSSHLLTIRSRVSTSQRSEMKLAAVFRGLPAVD
jgi:hypothetical protein